MKYTIQQAAEEFSLGNAHAVSDYLADDVRWTDVADGVRSGRQAVLDFCAQPGPEIYLPFENTLTISANDRIVITGKSVNGGSAYCDVYAINAGRIQEITSYFVKTAQPRAAHINPYLTFNGNCREAMSFYRECIGGELTMQAIGESPMAERMPARMKESILHATLRSGGFVLMGSDMCDEQGIIRGNSVSLLLDCGSGEEINGCYERLAAGGDATHRPETTFWGALFGDLTDKFGNRWLLNYNKQ